MNTPEETQGFASTGLAPALVQILESVGITSPTPIQAAAIPVALLGRDIIGVAQTGTGKTLAFALPIITRLRAEGGKALILAPTRELALQIDESIKRVTCKGKPALPSAVLIGGMSMYAQVQAMNRRPAIIIATPGRLEDHIKQRTAHLGDVKTFVLDEADRMLDMGFIPAIRRIASLLPKNRQTMLFSATMAPEITSLAADYMRDAERIEVAKEGTAAEQIEQLLCYVSQDRKPEILEELLIKHAGPTLVFSRTKHGAAKLSRKLSEAGHNATEIHSNRSLAQRRHSLDGFKSGRYRVLVATDVASRGIDVKDIALVVNYDLPDVASDYVHRIGRTGRAGKSGLAITLAAHDQYRDVHTIEKLMNKELPLSELSDEKRVTANSGFDSNRGRSRGNGGGRGWGGGGGGRSNNGGNGGGRPAWGGSRPSRFGPSEGTKARRPQVSYE